MNQPARRGSAQARHISAYYWPDITLIRWVALAVLLSGCSCNRGSESKASKKKPRIVEIHFEQPPPEDSAGFRPHELNHLESVRAVYKAASDPLVRALLLRIGSWRTGWAQAQELTEALRFARSKNKRTYCHFDETDHVGYSIAAEGCDTVGMTPAGSLNLVGVAVQSWYLKGLLDRIGVSAELLQIGKYKGAADPLTLTRMPEEVRSSLGQLVQHLEQNLIQSIAKGRKFELDDARKKLYAGPYLADEAKAAGLVDVVDFDSELRQLAIAQNQTDEVECLNEPSEDDSLGLRDVLQMLRRHDDDEDKPHVQLVHLTGTIMDGEQEQWEGAQAGPFVREMNRIGDDDNVRAVVIRIDSPGGSALGSDRMWHAAYQVSKVKPVIVSIGNMAASGGYYIASAGSFIWAEPSSLVGSIGVVGGKISFSDLAKQVGVTTEHLQNSPRASWMSAARKFTADERQILQAHLQATYDRFLARIATTRARHMQNIQQAAEGRIMSGTQAHGAGLVDSLGGLADALADARRRAKLRPNAPVYSWPPAPTLIDRLMMLTGSTASAPVDAHLSWLSSLSSLSWLAHAALAAPTMPATEKPNAVQKASAARSPSLLAAMGPVATNDAPPRNVLHRSGWALPLLPLLPLALGTEQIVLADPFVFWIQ